MDTFWNEFANSGTIDAYLKYRQNEDKQTSCNGDNDKQDVVKNGF